MTNTKTHTARTLNILHFRILKAFSTGTVLIAGYVTYNSKNSDRNACAVSFSSAFFMCSDREFIVSGRVLCGVSCSRLSLPFLSISFLGGRWDHWLYLGQICVFCGDGSHCSSIVGFHGYDDVRRCWRQFTSIISLLNPRLATFNFGRVITRLHTPNRLVVSCNFHFLAVYEQYLSLLVKSCYRVTRHISYVLSSQSSPFDFDFKILRSEIVFVSFPSKVGSKNSSLAHCKQSPGRGSRSSHEIRRRKSSHSGPRPSETRDSRGEKG